MAILFFNLRGVPQDEADDVRALLAEHEIDFYETNDGNWGVSMPAIWLNNEEDLPLAQPLFDEYQYHRAIEQRALYRQLKQQGEHNGFWRQTLRQPLRFLLYSGFMVLIAYCSVKWLFELGL